MKANELRIGNWVKRDAQSDGFQIDSHSFIENLFGERFTLRIIINNAESAHANSVEYVHQLQNLYFALTGNELEIK